MLPRSSGSYLVVASFAGSTDYNPTSASVSFAIAPASPTVTVTDAGGVYDGKAFAAKATVAGVSGGAAARLQGVKPTLTYYSLANGTMTLLASAPTSSRQLRGSRIVRRQRLCCGRATRALRHHASGGEDYGQGQRGAPSMVRRSRLRRRSRECWLAWTTRLRPAWRALA